MNKIAKLLMAILVVALGFALGFWFYDQYSKKDDQSTQVAAETDAQKFKKEYPNAAEDNPFVYKSASEVVSLLENGSGLVYFGFPECPWCQKYVSYLEEVANEENLNQIYYLNVRQIRQDNTAEYRRIVDLMKDHLDKDDNGNPRIFVPDIIALEEGKIIGHDNTSSLNSGADGTPDEWWTVERVDELKTKLREIIKAVKACTSVCNE